MRANTSIVAAPVTDAGDRSARPRPDDPEATRSTRPTDSWPTRRFGFGRAIPASSTHKSPIAPASSRSERHRPGIIVELIAEDQTILATSQFQYQRGRGGVGDRQTAVPSPAVCGHSRSCHDNRRRSLDAGGGERGGGLDCRRAYLSTLAPCLSHRRPLHVPARRRRRAGHPRKGAHRHRPR